MVCIHYPTITKPLNRTQTILVSCFGPHDHLDTPPGIPGTAEHGLSGQLEPSRPPSLSAFKGSLRLNLVLKAIPAYHHPKGHPGPSSPSSTPVSSPHAVPSSPTGITVVISVVHVMGISKIYSTPYHPQGKSVVGSYMRTLKKRLSALVGEDGRDWDLFLPAPLAHSTTPHVATVFSPVFLSHGREAVLPVQRRIDEPRLDSTS